MVDQMLGGLFGGQDDDDDDERRRSRARDFVGRYETGLPHEGYSDEEAVHNYRQVAGHLSPREYEEAAHETFGRMPREDRKRLRRELKQRSGGRLDVESDDPRELARATARYRQEDPGGGGGLASLFGLGDGGTRGRGDLVGTARGDDGGGVGDLLGNPLAKVALGGIAAVAVKKMLDR